MSLPRCKASVTNTTPNFKLLNYKLFFYLRFSKKKFMSTVWKDYQEKNKDRFLNEMLDLLRIPSVSAKSENKEIWKNARKP